MWHLSSQSVHKCETFHVNFNFLYCCWLTISSDRRTLVGLHVSLRNLYVFTSVLSHFSTYRYVFQVESVQKHYYRATELTVTKITMTSRRVAHYLSHVCEFIDRLYLFPYWSFISHASQSHRLESFQQTYHFVNGPYRDEWNYKSMKY